MLLLLGPPLFTNLATRRLLVAVWLWSLSLLFACSRGGVVVGADKEKVVSSPPIECTDTGQCQDKVGSGSSCLPSGFCSRINNEGDDSEDDEEEEFRPFYYGGCLNQRLPGWTKKRVCNSEDPPEAAEMGYCRVADFGYMEIRISTQNWESVFFESYLLQILLSELLDVPTTLETGTPDAKLNFYDPEMPFDYGIANDWDGFDRAANIVDCTAVTGANRKQTNNPDEYESCCHFVAENWDNSNTWVREQIEKGSIEFPQGLGMLGHESWFMPKFTIDRQPSLSTYMGLQGEKNRRKLADTFLRPTKWEDYCNEVSRDGCRTPDGVALRRPRDENEAGMYFVPDVYTGHFRKTARNDCEAYPNNCTGHIVDYPCGWSGYVEQISTHLNIALESNGDEPGSGGYTYSEMVQILMASNATKSDIAIQWWTPEAAYSQLLGTAAEMQRVVLPPTTQECVAARVDIDDRCSDNVTLRVGSPEGVCDEAAHPLHKLLSSVLYHSVYDPSIPAGSRSPAYDAIKLFSITNVQMDEIFEYWFARQSKGPGRSAREAVCDWAAENMAYLQEFVPRTYPRVLREERWNALFMVSTTVAIVTTFIVIWAAYMVFQQRHRRIIRFSQVEFLWLLLAGLLTLSLGAIFKNFPSNGTCVTAMWFVNFGYLLELVPLLVKVSAINRLMHAANNMKRVVVKRESLFGAVFCINGLLAVLLILWSVLDAPARTAEYSLAPADAPTAAGGETVVSISFYCSSESAIWRYIVVSINGVLLLWATVLAFQTHRLRQEFNESMTLAIMIYSHAVFQVLRLITFFLEGSVSNSMLAHCQSLVYSIDTIATIVIYFVPKFVTSDQERKDAMKGYHIYLQRLVAQGASQFSTAEHSPDPMMNDVDVDVDFDDEDVVHVVSEEERRRRAAAAVVANSMLVQRCRHCGKPTENELWLPPTDWSLQEEQQLQQRQEQRPKSLRRRIVTRRMSI